MVVPYTENEIERLMAQVKASLRPRFGSHPQFEDLLSAAYIGMWKSLKKIDTTNACSPATAAARGALWAALDWLRGSGNAQLRYNQRGRRLPVVLPLAAVLARGEGEEEECEGGEMPSTPSASRRWETSGEWARACLSGEEWTVVKRLVLDEEPLARVAAYLGRTTGEVVTIRRSALATLKRESVMSELPVLGEQVDLLVGMAFRCDACEQIKRVIERDERPWRVKVLALRSGAVYNDTVLLCLACHLTLAKGSGVGGPS